MTLLLYQASPSLARRILKFFQANQHKEYCRVSIADGEVVVYRRNDIPKLEQLTRQTNEA